MRKSTRVVLALLLALSLIVVACGDDEGEETTTTAGEETTTTAAEEGLDCRTGTGNITVGELAYYTGEFAPYGTMLTGTHTFPIEVIINQDPPLGRHWDFIAEDIGTVGEAAAAHKMIEEDGITILMDPAHGYGPYRTWFMEWVERRDGPLGPTLHGGSIPFDIGGDAQEPIFRAQGPDAGLGANGAVYAEMIGAQTVVIFATQVEGFQLAADAAEAALGYIGG